MGQYADIWNKLVRSSKCNRKQELGKEWLEVREIAVQMYEKEHSEHSDSQCMLILFREQEGGQNDQRGNQFIG